MREIALKTALFLLSVALLGPVASAHPLKSAYAPKRSVEPTRVSGHARGKQPVKSEARRTRKPTVRSNERPMQVAPGRTAAMRIEARHPASRRGSLLAANPRMAQRETKASSKTMSQPERVEETHLPPTAEPPASEAASPTLPPIEVHHNRKIHLTPETPAPSPDATPRKATVKDFLTTPASAAGNTAPGTSPAPPLASPATRHSPSVVERKLPAIPTVRPAATVIPDPILNPIFDPILDPVLYTSRGHLIVPPAMKGSQEILLHQNEMADRDGLIRVQDDDDLDRLRSAKQLVALPASSALEVDERLPLNRRFCRPWTAQFLAALARAHYARFHSPLQVNSAVRTVAFQERLRFTNSNAAPAEGETASPHLTGQAVDLAKHGLSTTEIAWMRGYLMPLVQQSKIDVEEEFTQACFHISVYKSYLPQPTPSREIPTRRASATALAAAIH